MKLSKMNRSKVIDKLIENADKCVNMYDLCQKIGIKNIGGEDYKQIRQLARELNINLIFSYKRDVNKISNNKVSIEEILVENCTYKDNTKLKKRLFKEGIKEYKCEICGCVEWLGKPISLQLHHINGNNRDNRLENLEILCPNCHSQTDNYSGKNSKRLNTTKYIKKEKNIKQKEQISKKHPSKNELITDFLELKSFRSVGKKYNVSDNTIKKWCKKYNLPHLKQELFEYIKDIDYIT